MRDSLITTPFITGLTIRALPPPFIIRSSFSYVLFNSTLIDDDLSFVNKDDDSSSSSSSSFVNIDSFFTFFFTFL